MSKMHVTLADVKKFWEKNPLCASAISHQPGSAEYFVSYDRMREANESIDFSYELHEYRRFSGKTVLDVGAGNGYVLSRYALEGASVCGVDVTKTAINICRRRFDVMGITGNFFVAGAEELPFEDKSFDCVCSMGVLHHVPDTARAVREIHRVLKDGGRLIVMFYHRDSALYRLHMPVLSCFTGKSLAQLVNEVDGAGNPRGDVYSRSELRQLLGGFRDVRMFAGLLDGRMMLPRIGKFLPDGVVKPFEKRFGWFLYAKGTK
jgi:SAM-dependent methyltransferase